MCYIIVDIPNRFSFLRVNDYISNKENVRKLRITVDRSYPAYIRYNGISLFYGTMEFYYENTPSFYFHKVIKYNELFQTSHKESKTNLVSL